VFGEGHLALTARPWLASVVILPQTNSGVADAARFWPGVHPSGAIAVSATTMQTGTVKFFNTSKGYGFIQPEDGSKDIFVHVSALQASGLDGLAEGQQVQFDIEADTKGPKAVNISLAD
jgi:CspA family cold shock protein